MIAISISLTQILKLPNTNENTRSQYPSSIPLQPKIEAVVFGNFAAFVPRALNRAPEVYIFTFTTA
jgi:hypothetical protein